MADALLGSQLITVSELQARSNAFGCALAISGWSNPDLEALVSIASRAVEGYTGRKWDAGATFSETHVYNPVTRRVMPDNPPLFTLTSFVLRTSPGTTSTFAVTPVKQDAGGNNVGFGAILYNRNENYLELASLAAAAGPLTAQVIALGITEPQVEITYTSYGTTPPGVVAATGFVAADMAQNGYLASLGLMPGVSAVKDNQQQINRAVMPENYSLPPVAQLLLSNFKRIAIR